MKGSIRVLILSSAQARHINNGRDGVSGRSWNFYRKSSSSTYIKSTSHKVWLCISSTSPFASRCSKSLRLPLKLIFHTYPAKACYIQAGMFIVKFSISWSCVMWPILLCSYLVLSCSLLISSVPDHSHPLISPCKPKRLVMRPNPSPIPRVLRQWKLC